MTVRAVVLVAVLALSNVGERLDAQLFDDSLFPESTIELTAPFDLARGSTGFAKIVINVPDGWHTYWRNPGDGGSALRVQWNLPIGIAAGEGRWPLPRTYEQGGVVSYGHEGSVSVHIPIVVSANAPIGATSVSGDIEWFVCEVVCLQYTATVETSFTVVEAAIAPNNRDRGGEARSLLAGTATSTDETLTLSLYVEGTQLPDHDDVWFFPFSWGVIDQSAHQQWERTDVGYTVALPRGATNHSFVAGLFVVYRDGEPITGFEIDAPIAQEG